MDPEAIAAVIVPLGMFSIPIVAILASHQRKMAALIRGNAGFEHAHLAELQSLRREVESLKEIVHSQALAMDDQVILRKMQTEAPPPMPAHTNLGGF